MLQWFAAVSLARTTRACRGCCCTGVLLTKRCIGAASSSGHSTPAAQLSWERCCTRPHYAPSRERQRSIPLWPWTATLDADHWQSFKRAPGKRSGGLSHTAGPLTGRRGRHSEGCLPRPPARPCIEQRATTRQLGSGHTPVGVAAAAWPNPGSSECCMTHEAARLPAGKSQGCRGIFSGLGVRLGLDGDPSQPGSSKDRQRRRLLREGEHWGCHDCYQPDPQRASTFNTYKPPGGKKRVMHRRANAVSFLCAEACMHAFE